MFNMLNPLHSVPVSGGGHLLRTGRNSAHHCSVSAPLLLLVRKLFTHVCFARLSRRFDILTYSCLGQEEVLV